MRVLELVAGEEALQRLGLLRKEGGELGVRRLKRAVMHEGENPMSGLGGSRRAEVLVERDEHAQARCSQPNLLIGESVDRDEGRDIGRVSRMRGWPQDGPDDQ